MGRFGNTGLTRISFLKRNIPVCFGKDGVGSPGTCRLTFRLRHFIARPPPGAASDLPGEFISGERGVWVHTRAAFTWLKAPPDPAPLASRVRQKEPRTRDGPQESCSSVPSAGRGCLSQRQGASGDVGRVASAAGVTGLRRTSVPQRHLVAAAGAAACG